PVRHGRFLRDGERHVAVLGDSLAASRGVGVGSRLTLEGQSYEVVGVLERMMTAPDRFVIVPIADAREQWVAKDNMLRTLLASDLQLGREVLAEALAVTLCGGAGGIAVALALGAGIDAWAGRTGQQLFYFSPRLLGGALLFSVLLGTASAAYATARIVRLSPADAIR